MEGISKSPFVTLANFTLYIKKIKAFQETVVQKYNTTFCSLNFLMLSDVERMFLYASHMTKKFMGITSKAINVCFLSQHRINCMNKLCEHKCQILSFLMQCCYRPAIWRVFLTAPLPVSPPNQTEYCSLPTNTSPSTCSFFYTRFAVLHPQQASKKKKKKKKHT